MWVAASTQVRLHERHREPAASHPCFPRPIRRHSPSKDGRLRRPMAPPSPLRGEGSPRCATAEARKGIFSCVIKAPRPPLRRPKRIDRRTAGLLARGVSPTPPSQARRPVAKMRRHAAHSRGGGRGSAKCLPRSLFTLIRREGPCGFYVSASLGVVKCPTRESRPAFDRSQCERSGLFSKLRRASAPGGAS